MCITNEERRFLKSEMQELLDEYGWEYSDTALDNILDTWATNNRVLIEAFKKHPNYVEGKFMIAFDADFEREIDREASRNFSRWLIMHGNMCEIPEEIKAKRDKEKEYVMPPYSPIDNFPHELGHFMSALQYYAQRTITESTATHLNEMVPEVHAHTGQKTSRVINKLCTYLGYDKVEVTENCMDMVDGVQTLITKLVKPYNREFAKYADSLSPLKVKRHTVLSINPIDFLTMSFGNSWASCHTIDKGNKRGMPYSYSGEYCSGTMSYMLDGTSMVLYTVSAEYDGNVYYTQPKITRQMFHYGEEKLVQSRLYPQGNDGALDLYTAYRNIVQQIISEIFEFPNLWTVGRGTDKASKYISSEGTHYRDYYYVGDCTLSRIKGSENEECMIVGHRPICIECGHEHREDDTINCCHGNGAYQCYECGEWLDEDDAIWVDGDYYCRDCVNYCSSCEEYHRDYEYYVEDAGWGGGYVCENCYENYCCTCEDCGDAYYTDNMHWIENLGITVCESCYENYYTCTECGDMHHINNMHSHNGDYYCDDCYDNIEIEVEEDTEIETEIEIEKVEFVFDGNTFYRAV